MEEFAPRHTQVDARDGLPFPARLRALLWLLAINGGLLAIEGFIQRLEVSGELLFLVKPRGNPGAEAQFGPYAYHSNAAQYLNVVWPVCLGFWWTLHRAGNSKRGGHHVLLLFASLMAACPFISTSRSGAIVTVGLAISAALFLVGSQLLLPEGKRQKRLSQKLAPAGVLLFLTTALALGFSLGWKTLALRMIEISETYKGREETSERERPMAANYPVFGTGPGTFTTVFQLYRTSTDTFWPAQLHHDWLETRITFGWVGCALIALALVTVLTRWFARGGIHGGRRFVVVTWMALTGCLDHARWDLPFQIHSILFLFLALCAVLFVLSRRWSSTGP